MIGLCAKNKKKPTEFLQAFIDEFRSGVISPKSTRQLSFEHQHICP
jgi:hypothetical protein